MASLREWMWLTLAMLKCDSRRLGALLDAIPSPKQIYHADKKELAATGVLKSHELSVLCEKSMSETDEIIGICGDKNINILTYQDGAYPEQLKMIYNPPGVLYYRGILPQFDNLVKVAIIGTRGASLYGMRMARIFADELAAAGISIITGMAKGIDAEASRAALKHDTPSAVVLGCGADVCYPYESRDVYDDIVRNGAVISEYPPGTEPAGKHFPYRNRIMSGLADGALVIEAPEKSGALITASTALEQGRDVFAIPGNIDTPSYVGCNKLISSGEAMAVLSAQDIIREYAERFPGMLITRMGAKREQIVREPEYGASTDERQKPPPKIKKTFKIPDAADADTKVILTALLDGQKHVDELISQTGIDSGTVMTKLMMLEITGTVTQLPGKFFRISTE